MGVICGELPGRSIRSDYYFRPSHTASVDPRRVFVDPEYDGPFKFEVVTGKPDDPGRGGISVRFQVDGRLANFRSFSSFRVSNSWALERSRPTASIVMEQERALILA